MTIKEKIKEFGLSNFAIKNSTSVFVLIFILLVAGLMSYNSMPKESFPEIKQPTIYVGISYPGNSPVDMENLITRPIEKEIKQLSGIKKLSSTSIQGHATIIVEFELDIDSRDALYDVKDAVDKSKSELPNDLPTDPNIFELDFSEFPIMNINLYGDLGYDDLKYYAEYLQDEIEKVSQISGVDIRGLPDKEVKVNVDLFKMQSLKITFQDIENAISSENVTMSGGDILSIQGDHEMRRSLRITGEFKDYKKMEGIIVKDENQETVTLGDIAEVKFGNVEPTSFARLDGENVVTLDIKKKSNENLLIGADAIKEILAKAKVEVLPSSLNTVITNDQSKFTRGIVKNLENSIISGVILVVLVLMFFMGVRNAAIVGTAIPLSMLLGIAILNYTGNTLNMMVLFSLILALGMLVDNGIVVVENIYRLYTEGYSKVKASKAGVGEVAFPIISSTATTVTAFIPLLFWEDLMGEFMKFLPLTLIIVLSSSLFVGLIVNPVLTSKFVGIENYDVKKGQKKFWIWTVALIIMGVAFVFVESIRLLGSLLIVFGVLRIIYRYLLKPVSKVFQTRFVTWMESVYTKTLSFALTSWRPYVFLAGTVLLLIFSLGLFQKNTPPVNLFPENEPNYVNVFIEMPQGTDIMHTNDVTELLEDKVNKAIEPYRPVVEAVLTKVGEGTGDPNAGGNLMQGSTPTKARITVSFLEYEERIEKMDVSTSVIMKKITDAVLGTPEAKSISVEKDQQGPPTGKPVNLEVTGENYDQLIKLTLDIKDYLEDANVPGVEQLKTDMEVSLPEMEVMVDRDAARRFGVSTYTVASTIRTALFGKEVDKYKVGEEDYPINIRLSDDQRYDLSTLLNMPITFRDQASGRIKQVPISSVVTVKNSSTLGSVQRIDQQRVITIFSNVKEGYNGSEIVDQYQNMMETYEMPEGFSYKFTGEQKEQMESMAFLQRAMMIAVFLIFLIIVSQFNSITSPIIILFSVVFSTIGVFLGFTIFQIDISIMMVGIGIISLAGIVVNNAIVLIDFIYLSRDRRRKEIGIKAKQTLPYKDIVASIITAGRIRFRPVILTAITTVLGLVPLAIGFNIDFYGLLTELQPNIYIGGESASFWGPMAWTVIFGLVFSTFLTLVIIPVMYLIIDIIGRTGKTIYMKING